MHVKVGIINDFATADAEQERRQIFQSLQHILPDSELVVGGIGMHVLEEGKTLDLLVVDYGGVGLGNSTAEWQIRAACNWAQDHPGAMLCLWTEHTTWTYQNELEAEFAHLENVAIRYRFGMASSETTEMFETKLRQWFGQEDAEEVNLARFKAKNPEPLVEPPGRRRPARRNNGQ